MQFYLFKIMSDLLQYLLEINESETIAEMWPLWEIIAQTCIPPGFDLRDASEGAKPLDDCSEENIRDTLDELKEDCVLRRLDGSSERFTAARCYWLDYAIRQYLGMMMRE
jgi:hypothetical protein